MYFKLVCMRDSRLVFLCSLFYLGCNLLVHIDPSRTLYGRGRVRSVRIIEWVLHSVDVCIHLCVPGTAYVEVLSWLLHEC